MVFQAKNFLPPAKKLVASLKFALRSTSFQYQTRPSSDFSSPMALSPEQLAQYERDGILAVPGFASLEECRTLKAHMEELLDEFDPSAIPTSVFSTKNQTKTTDEYFLESGNNISFFFEEKALNPDGTLNKPKQLAINKVGHALHDLDPVFRAFSRSKKVAALLKSLSFRKPIPAQSMYICKQPHVGGEVNPHQDSTFLWTDPSPTCVGLWVALEDATIENGCLYADLGSHKSGVHRRFILGPDRKCTFDKPVPQYDLTKQVPLEVKAGTLVLIHGAVLHMSKENTSAKSRHAYSVHVIEGAEGFEWSKENWMQRKPDFPFEPLSLDLEA